MPILLFRRAAMALAAADRALPERPPEPTPAARACSTEDVHPSVATRFGSCRGDRRRVPFSAPWWQGHSRRAFAWRSRKPRPEGRPAAAFRQRALASSASRPPGQTEEACVHRRTEAWSGTRSFQVTIRIEPWLRTGRRERAGPRPCWSLLRGSRRRFGV